MAAPRPASPARTHPGVRPLFEAWSYLYDVSLLQPLFYRRVHAAVLAAVGTAARTPSVVLDLGCGTGLLTADLRRRFPAALVVGLDLALGMLAAARRQQRGQALLRGDFYALPFPDQSADLITSTLAYHWCLEPMAALAEMRRVLRPGGRLVLGTLATHLLQGVVFGQRLAGVRRHRADLAAAGFAVEAERPVFPYVRVFTAR
jgi:ubiquinone/menaquinone biosynthesis C-methylase UbiE